MKQLTDFKRDGDGFLLDRGEWTEEFAQLVAEDENIEYNEELKAVVDWARKSFDDNGTAPTIREFGKGYYEPKFGKGGRKDAQNFLAKLTTGTGMKVIDKIAGLPKPTGCV